MIPVPPFFDLLAQTTALLVITVSMAQNLLYLILLLTAVGVMLGRPRVHQSRALWNGLVDGAPPVSVIVPAYNEAETIADSLRSLLALEYPDFRVVVVNDGSTDPTLEVLARAFELEPAPLEHVSALPHAPLRGLYRSARHANLVVLDKVNSGKADALNAGLGLVTTELFCAVDADSLIEADGLLRVVQPFVEDPERVVAVGGTVRVANGCGVRAGRVRAVALPSRLLPLLQTVEYLRAFMMARLAWGRIGCLMIVSGAFGLFRRDVVIELGGYSTKTVGEDLELVVRLHRRMRDAGRDYRIEFVPEPVCWTQVPETLGVLARQRQRWQRGALETFFRHKGMLVGRGYGRVGRLGLGHILLLDVVTPLVEVLGYVLLPFFWLAGTINTEFFLAYLALTFAFGVFISVASLVLEEFERRRVPRARDLVVLTIAAIVENFGYRQLANLWRIQGHWHYWRGAAHWGRQDRQGFAVA